MRGSISHSTEVHDVSLLKDVLEVLASDQDPQNRHHHVHDGHEDVLWPAGVHGGRGVTGT
jgi:hypothetical protein